MSSDRELKVKIEELFKRVSVWLLLIVSNAIIGTLAIEKVSEKNEVIFNLQINIQTAQKEKKEAIDNLELVESKLANVESDLHTKEVVLATIRNHIGNEALTRIAAIEMPNVLTREAELIAEVSELQEQVDALKSSIDEKDILIDNLNAPEPVSAAMIPIQPATVKLPLSEHSMQMRE